MENRRVLAGEIKAILKNTSRTLYLSVNILPEPARTLMGMGYLLCRTMDTVTDTPGVAAAEKLELIDLLRRIGQRGTERLGERVSRLARLAPSRGERDLLLKFYKVADLYSRFSAEDREFFTALLAGVGEGMEADVRSFPEGRLTALKAPADLENYCAHMGGAPGVFWARLYRAAIRRSAPSATQFPSESDAGMIGSALQMTNILKDLAADLRLGRCYIPQEDLAARGLKPQDLLNPGAMPKLREITARWTAWAVDRLDQCEAFVAAIPKTELALRAAVIWPVYWAMDTLEDAAHSNLLDPADRPRVGRGRIYATIAGTPPLLLSNTAFARGYRFRRETLIISITGGNFEGRAI
ncbi:MAG: phytoene/squalene synthase family protein [Elusimicrobiales bacterium]